MTHTFENLIQQREESFSKKEREIGNQIIGLDNKFEELRTENSRIKLENNEYHRRIESLSDEISNKDEQLRQLQWKLDDERNNKQLNDDQIHRKINQLNLDLAISREKLIQDTSDQKRIIDKVGNISINCVIILVILFSFNLVYLLYLHLSFLIFLLFRHHLLCLHHYFLYISFFSSFFIHFYLDYQ